MMNLQKTFARSAGNVRSSNIQHTLVLRTEKFEYRMREERAVGVVWWVLRETILRGNLH
jgi:hypothetical protein